MFEFLNFCVNRMIFYIFFFIFLLSQTAIVAAGFDASANLTDFMQVRQKRSLIYEGGGTIKLVIGPTLPVNLGDPIAWRSLICGFNLQGGHYTLPTTPLYPWDKWEDTFARRRTMKRAHENFERYEQYEEDESRLFAYTAYESYVNKQQQQQENGRACLLRSICENAQVQQHVGIFAELLNVLLTPGKENLDACYRAAYVAGKSGADCLKLYDKCPRGANILDQYLYDF